LNPPGECRDLAVAAVRERELLASGAGLDAEATLGVLERSDAFRRPERLERLLEVAECDTLAAEPGASRPRAELPRALAAARNVDAASIAREHPEDVPGAVRRARLAAIAELQPPTGH
jgi:tRNA nucleotidyltransferase (CCA-adding enzyme)